MIIPDKKLKSTKPKKVFWTQKKYPKNVLCVLLLTNYYSKTFRVSYILRKNERIQHWLFQICLATEEEKLIPRYIFQVITLPPSQMIYLKMRSILFCLSIANPIHPSTI